MKMFLKEPKMCWHAWQLLGMLGKDVASMPRTLQSMPRSAENVAKHA